MSNHFKIAEVILRERRKRNMTQEELASVLTVSPQAVSHWERGGYPDITLLPRIANFFQISIDELFGNDDISRKADIENFIRKFNAATPKEQLTLSKEYYGKYPGDFQICDCLAMAILRNKEEWEKEYPLLKEVCNRILSDCTWEHTRQNALECMCIVCPDEEWGSWKYKSEQFYSSCQNERVEERLWQRRRYADYQKHNTANHLLCLMHFLGREYMRYYEKDNGMLFENPAVTAALMKYRMRILESLSENGEIPEAWLGCYADLCLKAAGALIASRQTEEGFDYLARVFPLFEAWLQIPDGKKMEVGMPALFGQATISKVNKNCVVNIFIDDELVAWVPDLWLFWQNRYELEKSLSAWPWFDAVREDARFLTAYRRAVEMAEKE